MCLTVKGKFKRLEFLARGEGGRVIAVGLMAAN